MSRRSPKPKPRRLTVTIPERVGPYVKLVFAEMARQGHTYDDVEFGSGVLRPTLKAWRHKNAPSLQNIEAVLGFLGWDLVPIPRNAVLPPEIVRELQPIADRLGLTLPNAIQAVVDIVAGIHEKAKRGSKRPVLRFRSAQKTQPGAAASDRAMLSGQRGATPRPEAA